MKANKVIVSGHKVSVLGFKEGLSEEAIFEIRTI